MAKPGPLVLAEYLLARFLLLLIRPLPWRLASGAGVFFGTLVRLVSPGLRRTVNGNLALAFGREQPLRARRRLARACFRHFGRTVFECLRLFSYPPSRLLNRVRFVNLEAMDAALAGGRGAIAITAHLGNWEIIAAAFAASGRPVAAIVRPLDNPLLDRAVERLRGRFGTRVIPRGAALRDGLKALKHHSVLAFLIDQNAARHGIFVPFFGTSAATVIGPARIAAARHAPVLTVFDRRERDGSHTITFSDPLPEPADRSPAALAAATACHTAAVEEAIRKNPEQWLWMHPRWRTRPPDRHSEADDLIGDVPCNALPGHKPEPAAGD
jgi:KDO2-lipid IV(A) lauroyltransferase